MICDFSVKLAMLIFMAASNAQAFTLPSLPFGGKRDVAKDSPSCLALSHDRRGGRTETSIWATNIPDTPKSVLASKPSRLSRAKSKISAFVRRKLWPNYLPDPDVSTEAPLPPSGSLGCPLLGNTEIILSSRKFGQGSFWRNRSRRMNAPRVWRYYLYGKNGVTFSGGKLVKQIQDREFQDDGIVNFGSNGRLIGSESMLNEKNKDRYMFLRRLVGASMTPAAVSLAMPVLKQSAEKQIAAALESSASVGFSKAADICSDFTIDVAWRQILGLKLSENEAEEFKKIIKDWMTPSLRLVFKIRPDSSKAVLARIKLEEIIGKKIDELERSGPDASTLSGMVFARDDESADGESVSSSKSIGPLKLTREQAIDNSLVLIVAGSETAAATLQNIMLLLKLHPEKWTKVVEEQDRMRNMHGESIEKDVLDKECPYLEAVIKEAMRIRPVESGNPRLAKSTQIIGGYQVQKDWALVPNIQLTHELDPVTFKEDYSHMDLIDGFKPERWLDASTRPSTDYIPMGAGYRYCLGSILAYAEMKVFLAVLARRVDYELCDGMDSSEVSMKRLRWKRMGFLPNLANGMPFRAVARETLEKRVEAKKEGSITMQGSSNES